MEGDQINKLREDQINKVALFGRGVGAAADGWSVVLVSHLTREKDICVENTCFQIISVFEALQYLAFY